MRSATEVRAQFKSADDATQRAIIKDLFGQYTREVHDLMMSKLTNVSEDAAGVGVIASKRQRNDPRYKTSLTVDVAPGTLNKTLRAFKLK
jgi:hypothetical protein